MQGRSVREVKQILTVVLVLAMGVTVSAQLSDEAQLNALTQSNSLGVKPAASPFSLLDLSRLRWSHSYSMSFFSGDGYSGSVGLLNSMMLYDLSSKLTLGLNLGIAHNLGGWSNTNQRAAIFPGFWLDFHPSNKFNMNISVQRSPGIYDPFAYRSHMWPRYSSPY